MSNRPAVPGTPFTGALSRRLLRAGIALVAALCGLAVGIAGYGSGLERQLHAVRDALRERPASGHYVLVAVDPRSLAKLDRWPWPRSYHARAITMLERAQAATIAFDVDFSSRSTPSEDRKLAAAIRNATVPIVLPTFRQYSATDGGAIYENLPVAALRANAQLAAVNIDADQDGIVRRYPFGVKTGHVARPSIGAILAGASGSIGEEFPIDGAIDPASIPSFSFVDLLDGRIPAGALRGKSVLIGATAIELGDRYPMARHGVLPGATIQLLAAETLQDGSSPVDRGMVVPLALAILAIVGASRFGPRMNVAGLAAAASLLAITPLALEMAHLGTVEIVPALCALLVGAGLSVLAAALHSIRQARTIDQDTGLLNRRGFEDMAARMPIWGVVAVQIENYRDAAGVLGKARAAELIERVVDRLTAAGVGTCFRLEEGILAWTPAPTGTDRYPDHLEGLIALLRAPVEVAGRRLELRCVAGLAPVVEGADVSTLADHAILAADQAAQHGRRWDVYSEEIDRERDWQLSLVTELDDALAAGDIWVAYQPKLEMARGQVTAAEALVRWRHPERGAVPPDDFIPALEANGRILDLTLFVLSRAVADAARWHAAGTPINVAVNVSALLATDPAFLAAVGDIVASGAIAPSLLTLEVTESATLADPQRAIAALETLAALGIKLSIDDYGTGQSTLSYLKQLPAKEIKIDKSFVLGLAESRSDQAMVRSTVDLAHELGFRVVAEGVENQPILDFLIECGCDFAQGWHVGRPISAADFTRTFCARLAA